MYEYNPLFHEQLNTEYDRLRDMGIHLGVADKFLFKKLAEKKISSYIMNKINLAGSLDILKDKPLEDFAILDGIPDTTDEFIEMFLSEDGGRGLDEFIEMFLNEDEGVSPG